MCPVNVPTSRQRPVTTLLSALTASVLCVALATPTWANIPPTPGGDSGPVPVEVDGLDDTTRSQLDSLIDPSQELRSTADLVTELTEKAQRSVQQTQAAQQRQKNAQRRADTARQRAQVADAEAQAARDQLGQYAVTAYINGGTSAGVAAALTSASPSQLVARTNTLTAVADNSTDVLRALRAAEDRARTARDRAAEHASDARQAAREAREHQEQAQAALDEAEQLLRTLIQQESEAQSQTLAEAVLRARSEAYAQGAGQGVVGADGVPEEYRALGNGRIPRELLAPVADTGHYLWPPAARALTDLIAAAAAEGVYVGITDSYRPYEVQVSLVERKGLYSEGGLAARPGTSFHGWGVAVDLVLDGAAQRWMRQRAVAYGFVEDVPREPWHWHFLPTLATVTPPAPAPPEV